MVKPVAEGWTGVTEAAIVTGYSGAYVRLLARTGQIGAQKVNQGWLVNLGDLLNHRQQMNQLGASKHNPWRDDLAASGRGRTE